MTEDICYADASDLARRIASRELSPVDVVDAFQKRIDAVNPRLNAIVVAAPNATEEAREAEAA